MQVRELRVLFIGMDRPFSTYALRPLARKIALVGVVESRVGDAPADASPVNASPHRSHLYAFARARRLPFHVIHGRFGTPADFVRSIRPDVICVAGMAQMLRADSLSIPRLGAINLHPSLLPNYRGPDPFFWQYHEMDLAGGVTVHQIDEGIDTGDIFIQRPMPIALGEPGVGYLRRAAETGADAMLEALTLLAEGSAQPRVQRDQLCPVFARIPKPGESFINWNSWNIERAWHFLRGVNLLRPQLPNIATVDARWHIGEIDRKPTQEPPGSIARDDAGYYVAHPAGRIRLTLQTRPGPLRQLIASGLQRIRRAAGR